MSLPRRSRLTAQAQFRNVFQQPVVSSDAFFKVLARPNGVGHARVGLAVSRQVDPRAVQRNRLKRIVRESFRERYARASEPVSGSLADRLPADYVVLPRRAAVTISNAELRERLSRHWAKIDERLAATVI